MQYRVVYASTDNILLILGRVNGVAITQLQRAFDVHPCRTSDCGKD
jgi:hypothetical protein